MSKATETAAPAVETETAVPAVKGRSNVLAVQRAMVASDKEHAKIAGTALDGHIAAQLKATLLIEPLYRAQNTAHIASQKGAMRNRKNLSFPVFTEWLKGEAKAAGGEWTLSHHKVAKAVAFAPHDAGCKSAFLSMCVRDKDGVGMWTEYIPFVKGWGKEWYNADGTLTAKGTRERGAVATQSNERASRDLHTGDHLAAILNDEDLAAGEVAEDGSFEIDVVAAGTAMRAMLHDLTWQVNEWFAENVPADSDEEAAIKAAIKKLVSDAGKKS